MQPDAEGVERVDLDTLGHAGLVTDEAPQSHLERVRERVGEPGLTRAEYERCVDAHREKRRRERAASRTPTPDAAPRELR